MEKPTPWFYSDSKLVLPNPFWYRTGGTGLESGQNQVPVSPFSIDRRPKINLASGPPWDQKIGKKNVVVIDQSKVVKWLSTIFSICHLKK